jgi:lipoprotein NlpI
LDKSGALADSTEAAFALHDGKPEEAIRLLLMAIKINNSDCIEYLELGDSYKALGRLDEAHESFGMALRCWHTKQQSDYIEKAINGLAKAYYANGWRAQLNGDSVSALTALGRAIELNPQYAEAFDLRGFIRYQLHDFPGALTDFHVGCTLESSDIWHVYLWLDRARLGEEVAATEELKVYWANRRVSGLNDWPSKIEGFLIGKVAEKELFAAADDKDKKSGAERHCEAYFYAGTKRLITGDKTTAVTYLYKSITTHATNCYEYQSAVSELKYLNVRPQP